MSTTPDGDRRRGLRLYSLARKPPSTGKTTPVIQAAASLERNATAPATSAGAPARRSGTLEATMSSLDSPYFVRPALILVGMYPGATTFTVMSRARLRRELVREFERQMVQSRFTRVVRKRRILLRPDAGDGAYDDDARGISRCARFREMGQERNSQSPRPHDV